MKNLKKIILIFLFSVFLVFLFSSFGFAQRVEEIYPQVPGARAPTTVKTLLPQYIKYLFNFSILIAGLIAFLSLVYGGVRYLTSAGNPAALGEAKAQITAGILGLAILLASFLILLQINPQLVVLKIGKAEFGRGVILYAQTGCPEGEDPEGAGLEEGKDFLRVRSSMSSLGDFNNQTQSVYFYNSTYELEVKIFRNTDYKDLLWETNMRAPYERGFCLGLAPPDAESIQLFWKRPGVYLFTDENCQTDPQHFISDVANFVDFHDKAKSIKIIPRTETICDVDNPACPWITNPEVCQQPRCQKPIVKDKMGAVLHEHSGPDGDAEVFFGGWIDTPPRSIPCITLKTDHRACSAGHGDQTMTSSYCLEHVRDDSGPGASAITIFLQRPPGSPPPTGGVTLYEHEDYNRDEPEGDSCGPFRPPGPEPQWVTISNCDILGLPGMPDGWRNGEVSSIKVEGDYMAVLFRGSGKGEVFRVSAPRLKDRRIGNDSTALMLVIPVIQQVGI